MKDFGSVLCALLLAAALVVLHGDGVASMNPDRETIDEFGEGADRSSAEPPENSMILRSGFIDATPSPGGGG